LEKAKGWLKMSGKRSSVRNGAFLAGAALGAGLTLIANQNFRKHPEYLPSNIRRKIALDRALSRARRAGHIPLTQASRYVIFSDHHKGGRDRADDFLPCEPAYLSALDFYFRENYNLIILGDAEELLEETIPRVLDAYPNVLQSEARFYPERYIRFSGNHDNAWEMEDLVRQYLDPFFPGIEIYRELILEFRDELDRQGEILLLHGHQGTLDGDIFDFLPPHVLPLYRQFQNLTGLGHTSPSRDAFERSHQDNQMYTWASQQEKLILIAGHTHRPIWGSMTHLERLLAQFHALLRMQPRPDNFEGEVARLQGEIEHRVKADPPKADTIKTRPCYFNTGCCRFSDGDITGIEFQDGEIRLIKWGRQNGGIERVELERIRLAEVFVLL
jgi:hypothetical protein